MYRWLSIVLVAVGAFGLGGCGGGNGSGNPFNGGKPLACEEFATPPPGCDSPCPSGSDSECELGTYCFNGVCSAQCTVEQGCGEDFDCNSRGRCIPIFSGTGGNTGTGGSTGCQSVQVTPTRSVPNAMFLVDQSGSMTSGFGGGQNRWEAAHSAVTSVVSQLDSIVRFGLTTYQSENGDDNPPCPRFDTQVAMQLDNLSTINMSYPATFPGGEDTPTGDSIDALVSIIQADPPPADGPTIIVLATDGEPDSCEVPDPNPTAGAQAEAVAAAQNAFDNANIQTFILSVGTEVSNAHLQDMANVGIGLAEDGSEGNATFWVATDPQSLEDAFNQIISDSISCEVQIDKPFDDKEKACNDPESDVRLNGTPLSCPTDWRVKPGADDIIELVGSACDTFKSGAATLTAVFPCGAIVVE
jgi:hypothetical protein